MVWLPGIRIMVGVLAFFKLYHVVYLEIIWFTKIKTIDNFLAGKISQSTTGVLTEHIPRAM